MEWKMTEMLIFIFLYTAIFDFISHSNAGRQGIFEKII